MESRIRIQPLALVRQSDRILVEEGRDELKDETFFPLLGGTVELGETGAETLLRELLEELGAEADVGRLVATIENRFTYEARRARARSRLRVQPSRRAPVRARRVGRGGRDAGRCGRPSCVVASDRLLRAGRRHALSKGVTRGPRRRVDICAGA